LASYEKKYPKSLFSKGVRVLNEDHVGHIMKETADKIVVFGDYNYRFDVPKSKIKEVGRNVILNTDFAELVANYTVDRKSSLSVYPEEKEDEEQKQQTITKSITNMVMGNNNGDNIIPKIIHHRRCHHQ
jgi:hypothetical protein